MQQGIANYSDMQQSNILNSNLTRDMGINKQHARFTFLKIDRRDGGPPLRARQE